MSHPKGYAPWRPNDETLLLVARVRSILDEYASYGPMTARLIPFHAFRLLADRDIDG